jgi:hypothetical protein
MDPSNSFALSFLAKGAVGYVGHLRMYGVNWFALEPVLYGLIFLNMSQGQALNYAFNSLLTSYVDPITLNFTTSYDWLTSAKTMVFGYILYGDPAYKTLY